jgi:nucleotide-binding universal stress UspA family protein
MIRKILVGLDGSPRAASVFEAALEIAVRFGATLQPFRAVFVPPEFPPAGAGGRSDPLPAHLSKRAHEDLVRLAARASALHITILPPLVRVGDPSKLIIDVSEELDVDLIVIGSHGYGGLDRILGTTAGRVANLAHRDVLVVHERADRLSTSSPSGSPYRRAGGQS